MKLREASRGDRKDGEDLPRGAGQPREAQAYGKGFKGKGEWKRAYRRFWGRN